MSSMLTLLFVLYAIFAFAVFMLIWQGPYTGGGHLTSIPHSVLAGALWPLLALLLAYWIWSANRGR